MHEDHQVKIIYSKINNDMLKKSRNLKFWFEQKTKRVCLVDKVFHSGVILLFKQIMGLNILRIQIFGLNKIIFWDFSIKFNIWAIIIFLRLEP